ncbi:homeobox domain-containing protein 11 [Vairimorpha necatrix]|uniref:Homeobox domain-containing protein 11 n=1 Tax=Vairimorpha necatrix TaxID=6039 RepID=A0AAX4JBH3_9MICR
MKFIDQEKTIMKYYISDTKRGRLRMNKYQIDMLNRAYYNNPYPNKHEKFELNIMTKIPIKNIKIWFQNKRSRERL